MNSLHNHQRVVVQMEQPVLGREGGFPVKKSYIGSIRKNHQQHLREYIGMRFEEVGHTTRLLASSCSVCSNEQFIKKHAPNKQNYFKKSGMPGQLSA